MTDIDLTIVALSFDGIMSDSPEEHSQHLEVLRNGYPELSFLFDKIEEMQEHILRQVSKAEYEELDANLLEAETRIIKLEKQLHDIFKLASEGETLVRA